MGRWNRTSTGHVLEDLRFVLAIGLLALAVTQLPERPLPAFGVGCLLAVGAMLANTLAFLPACRWLMDRIHGKEPPPMAYMEPDGTWAAPHELGEECGCEECEADR